MPSLEGNIVSVGKRYDCWKSPVEAFAQIEFCDSFWQVAVGFPYITSKEVHDFQYGAVTMSYAVIDGCLFFLFKFGAQNWMDAPYEPRFCGKKFDFYKFEQGMGAILNVIVVDNATGEVKAIRTLGLGNILSNHLHESCKALQSKEDFNIATYRKTVEAIYGRFPLSGDMLKTIRPEDIFIIADKTRES